MTTHPLSIDERRVAPRFETSFAAELASGTVLVSVLVRELSSTGCRVITLDGDPDIPDALDDRGLLHLPAVNRGTFGTILPVILRYVRSDGKQVVYGLEFGSLLAHQTRKLNAVLEAMRQSD